MVCRNNDGSIRPFRGDDDKIPNPDIDESTDIQESPFSIYESIKQLIREFKDLNQGTLGCIHEFRVKSIIKKT